MKTDTKTVLITGASSGIGYEIAKLFARDGFALVLVSRDREALERVARECEVLGASVLTISKDLSVSTSPQEIMDTVLEKNISVDILVNNAGVGLYGKFLETDPLAEIRMIRLNVEALTVLTKLFLPQMLKRGSGRILNVASVAGFLPGPLMAVYYATKAYVVSLSLALSNELLGTGVTVTLLCPGPTSTGFEKTAKLEGSRLFKGRMMKAETVAGLGYEGLLKGKRMVVPGMKNKITIFGVRFLPMSLVLSFARRAQEKMK